MQFDIKSAILSGDPVARNKAYSLLLNDAMILNKIKSWANTYRLTSMEPDDVLQEAIIKMDGLLLDGVFQGKSKLTTFLLGIAFNIIRDTTGLKKRFQLKGVLTDNDCPDPETVADQLLLIEETAQQMELQAEVERLTLQLRRECQDALQLQYRENKSMKEIAPIVNVKNSDQAKKLLSVCRQQLRTLCEKSPIVQRLKHYLQ